MIKSYTIFNAKKYNYSECVIPNLIKISELDDFLKSKNNNTENEFKRIVNIDEVYQKIIELAKQITPLNYSAQKPLIKKWTASNYFPYPISDLNNPIDDIFLTDIKNIFNINNISNILKKIIKKKTILEKDINNLKSFLEEYNILAIINDIGTNSLDFKNLSFDNFLLLLRNNNLTLDNKDEFCYLLLNILISYVSNIVNNSNYIINNTMPIMFRKKNGMPKFYLYKSSNCIIAIAYYKLLNILISNTNDSLFKFCEYCDTPFQPSGNQKFCEVCISKGIPKKLRDQRYRKSDKGITYYKQYYKKED